VMAFLQSPAELEGILAIAVSRSACHRQQLIGYLSHGADYHDRLLRGTAFHDGGCALNCFGILDRGAAEFHYAHRWEVLRQIGRASCRERVEIWGAGRRLKKKQARRRVVCLAK